MSTIKKRFSSSRSRFSQLFLIASLTLFAAFQSLATENQTEARNHLTYNRLRHHPDYLQLYRNLQLREPYEEIPIELKLNTNLSGTVINTYYENNQSYADDISLDQLVLEALDRTYVSRMFVTNYHHYDNPEDRRKASDPSLVSPSRCASELKYLRTKLDELTQSGGRSAISPELAAFFDSFASQEPGILFGNYHWTGNWRQCSKRLVFDLDRSNTSNSVAFRGRYCTASIRSDRWQAKIEQRARERAHTYYKSAAQQYDYKRFFRIQLGICLPESCDSTSFDQAELFDLIRQLAVRKLNEPFRSYTMVDLFCLPDETSELRQLDSSGRLFVLVALVWCSLIAAVTYYDVFKQPALELNGRKPMTVDKSALDKLVTAISLRRNYERLTRSSVSPSTQAGSTSCSAAVSSSNHPSVGDLAFIDFFKAFSMPLIMFGHMAIWLSLNEIFPLAIDKGHHSIINAAQVVDWFFVIAGFITVYYLFATKRLDRMTIPQWVYTVFHRYWRLAPIYIIVFWFCRSVFQHTGRGPIWDYGTTNMTQRGVCMGESWLWPITLTSNFHPFHEECIMPSWFLSVTFQYWLFTPFILVGLARWPAATWLVTISLIGSSVALRIHGLMTQPLVSHVDLLKPRFDYLTHMGVHLNPLYELPHYRVSPYLIGLLAGHYTYMVLSGKWSSIFYSANNQVSAELKTAEKLRPASKFIFRHCVWFASVSFMLLTLNASWYLEILLPSSIEPYAKPIASLIYGTMQAIVGLAIAMILITFMLGQCKKLRSSMAHPIWSFLSKLNVSLLLIHCELIHWAYENAERMSTWNYIDIFKDWLVLICACYPLAIVSTLLLDLPLATLEREFIGNWLSKNHSVEYCKREEVNATANEDARLHEKESCNKLKKDCQPMCVVSKE